MAKKVKPVSEESNTQNIHTERLLWACFVALAAATAFVWGQKSGRHQTLAKMPIRLPSADQSASTEELLRNDWHKPPEKVPKGVLFMKWQTPIWRVNLAPVFENPKIQLNLGLVNSNVKELILRHYENLYNEHGSEVSFTGWESNGINQKYFEWQTNSGWKTYFASDPAVQALERIFEEAVDVFLLNIGLAKEEIQSRKKGLHAWATVNHEGISHLSHTHPDHMISGVYYVNVPPDSGPLIFSDPRGVHPPFDGTLTIKPKAGDLILFPSWLSHQVAPTPGKQPRISIAFNCPGQWSDTTGIEAQIPLDAK
eukprot:m.49282 g.49282  ORF g.49282 m.49282 type:complete len:311 (+) comp10607_c1_seq1:244-1176(+)